jgi:6-phosphogluconolactonase (cycloisomerase 2 family)
MHLHKWVFILACVALSAQLTGCGNGGEEASTPASQDAPPPPPPSPALFAVGGSVTGLYGTLVLRESISGEQLTVAGTSSFAVSARVPAGTPYNVVVAQQPGGQRCLVATGAGVVSSDVTGIAVTCSFLDQFVYVVDSASNGAVGFRMDATSGALTTLTLVAAGNAPRDIGFEPSENYAYILTGAPVGGPPPVLGSFRWDRTNGTLAAFGTPSSTFGSPVQLVTTSKFAYVARSDGAILSYPIDPATGALPVMPTATTFASGQLTGMFFSPDRRFLILTHFNALVTVLAHDAATGTLTNVAGSPFNVRLTGGFSLVDAVLHPSGKFIFTSNQNDGMGVFGFDAQTGAISSVLQFLPLGTVGSVAMHPSGKYLMAGGGTGVRVFAVDQGTGQVSNVPGSPFSTGGSNLNALKFDATGRFLVTSNSTSDNISVMGIDLATGSLAHVPGSPFSSVGGFPIGLEITAAQ